MRLDRTTVVRLRAAVMLIVYPLVRLTTLPAALRHSVFRTRVAAVWRGGLRRFWVILGFSGYIGIHYLLAYLISAWLWWLIAGFFIVSAVIAAVAFRPTHVFLVWLTISPLGVIFLRLDWGKDLPAVTFDRVAIYSLSFALLIRLLGRRTPPRRLLPAEWAMILFPIYAFASFWLFPHRSSVDVANAFVGNVLVVMVLYFVTRAVLVEPKHVSWTLVCLVVVGVYSALSGYYEHFTGRTWYSYFIGHDIPLQWSDIGMGRAGGPFSNTTVYGSFLGLATFVAFHLSNWTRRHWARAVYYVSMAVMVIGCYFSYTRGGYLPLIVFVLLMPWLSVSTRKAYAVLATIAAVAAVLAIPVLLRDDQFYRRITDRTNIAGRVVLTATSFNSIRHHPWFGVGLGNVDEAMSRYITNAGPISGLVGRQSQRGQLGLAPVTTSHNSFLTVLVEMGLVGGLLYWGSFFLFLAHIVRIRSRAPAQGFAGKDLASTVLVAMVGYLMSISVYDVRFFTYPTYLVYILFALCIRSDEMRMAGQEAEECAASAPVSARLRPLEAAY